MALVNDSEAVRLLNLFARMDASDETGAVRAMTEAATFLREHDLSFREIVQQIELRGLLLPSKIGAAIQLMDSTTLSEAQGALAGARRLMRSCGLTFERLIEALDRKPAEDAQCEQLRRAYQIEVERSREMAAELQILRAGGVMPDFYPIRSSFKNFVLVATLLLGLVLAASIASTITDVFKPANATGRTHSPVIAQRNDTDHSLAPRPATICWRDRSIHGPCF